MTRVELAPEVIDDFDRILLHLQQCELADASARIMEIVQALEVLTNNPLIGRRAAGGKRVLVIGRESHVYVALYQYVDKIDAAFVLAVRSQRESGCPRP